MKNAWKLLAEMEMTRIDPRILTAFLCATGIASLSIVLVKHPPKQGLVTFLAKCVTYTIGGMACGLFGLWLTDSTNVMLGGAIFGALLGDTLLAIVQRTAERYVGQNDSK
ncbi:MAG: hypothetical protein AAGE65_06955 [Planctomycetota bacterium]